MASIIIQISQQMIYAHQITKDTPIATLSSILRSSSFYQQISFLSVQQINLLLEAIPVCYEQPVNENEYPRAVIEQTLNIRKGQLIRYQTNPVYRNMQVKILKDEKQPSSNWWQAILPRCLQFTSDSTQPASQRSKMAQSKRLQQADRQDSQLSSLLPNLDIKSKSKSKVE